MDGLLMSCQIILDSENSVDSLNLNIVCVAKITFVYKSSTSKSAIIVNFIEKIWL